MRHLDTTNKPLNKIFHLLGIFLEIHLIMSTCIQNLKGVFSPPYSHRIGKKRFKRYHVLCSYLCYTTKLFFPCLDLPCITSQVWYIKSPWMTLLSYFPIAKYKCLRKSQVALLNQPCYENTTKKGLPLPWLFADSDPTEGNAALQSNAQAVDWHTCPSRDILPFLASVRPVVAQHLCKLNFETNTINSIVA